MFIRVLTLVLLWAPAAGWAQGVVATVLRVQGEARLAAQGAAEIALQAGAMVRPGSRILTRENALVVLMMDDGSRVSLGPNTEITLAQGRLEKEGRRHTAFEMVKGLFRATVQRLSAGSSFEVRTHNAVAAVKGTDFEVAVGPEGTEARVGEGTVWLQNARGERAELRAGMAARAMRDGGLGQPRRLSDEERRNFGAWARQALAPRSGEPAAGDEARRAAWEQLRPDQKAKVAGDLRDSLGEAWDDIVGLKAEERRERWRDRLREADARRLAAENARVDFALRKTALDRQGRRVRFDEFLVRPAADQIQFLNYTRRDDRTDLISSLNTYNRPLPQDLAEAPGLNQRIWRQGLANPPRFWLVESSLVAGNSSGDSFAANNLFYDPYFRPVSGYWELPVKQAEVRINIPDLQRPREGGQVLELWTRNTNLATAPPGGTLSPMAGVNATSQPGRAVPGTTNNLSDIGMNLVWALGGALPQTVLLGPEGLEAKPGDLAFGFVRRYGVAGTGNGDALTVAGILPVTLEFRNYVINENGQIVNLANIAPDKLMEHFVNQSLIASLKQVEIRSGAFKEADGINVVSRLLFLHDLFKGRDEL